MASRQIFNANTQQLEEAELTVDPSNEIVATFADGTFVKFPSVIVTETAQADADATVTTAPMTKAVLDTLIQLHQEHNEGKEIITPELEAAQLAERNNALALIGEEAEEAPQTDNGNTMPEGDATNVPSTDPDTNPAS